MIAEDKKVLTDRQIVEHMEKIAIAELAGWKLQGFAHIVSFARAIERAVLEAAPASSATGLSREQIAKAAGRVMGDGGYNLFMGYIDDELKKSPVQASDAGRQG